MRSGSGKTLLAAATSLLLLGLVLPGAAAQTTGEIEWESVGPTGVSILALVPHPTDPLTLYAVVDAHGVYKSTDGGESWQAKNQGIEGLTVLSLCIADETGEVLYAGTLGGGVFKSTDGGETWAPTGDMVLETPEVEATGPLWGLSLAAVNETVLYAGTGAGIYKSEDGGERWYPLNEGLGSPPGLGVDVWAILPDPWREDEVFIGANQGIFKSEDNGASWQQESPSITNALAFADDGKTIYAGSVEGLLRSKDEGEHWEVMRQARRDGLLEVRALLVDGASLYVGTCGGLYETSDGRHWESRNGDLPLDGLVVRGIVKRGKWLYIGTGQGIFRSEDNGASWVQLNHGLSERGLIVKKITFGNDEEHNLYIGTWGGAIYRSVDLGATWSEASHGLGAPYVYELTTSNGTLYAATSRALYISDDAVETWDFLASPMHSERCHYSVFVVPQHPGSEIYALIWLWEEDSDNKWKSIGRLVQSGDSGSNWQAVESLAAFNVTDVLVNPQNHRMMYVATRGNGVYRSVDGGNQWNELDQESAVQNIHTLALGGEEGNTLFAGTPIGLYRRGQDGIWERTTLGSYNTIVTDPSHPNRVYAANSEGALIYSEDYGKTWTSAGFAEVEINDLVVDPDGNSIYAATEGQSVLRGSVRGLLPIRQSLAVLRCSLLGLGVVLIIGVVVALSLRHYPAYAAGWIAARGHPLQQIIPLVIPWGEALDSETLRRRLRATQAFSTEDQVQGALDGLVERGIMKREDDAYRFVSPWTAWVHRLAHRRHIPTLAETIRTQHPLYTRTRDFFVQANFRMEELGAEEFLLTPQGQAHPQAGYGPLYARLIAGRAPTGDDFATVCQAASAQYGDDLSHRVALVISDRRPEPGARYRLYEIRQREGLAIVPLDVSLFGQIKPNRTANDILTSEIDQATGQQNLYAISGPVSGDLSFFGRERVLQEIIDLLNMGQPVGIFGLRKVGKTSLIQRLQGRLARQRPIALVDIQKTAQQRGIWSLYPDIIAAFASHLQRHQPEVTLPNLRLWPEHGSPSPAMADAFVQDLQALHTALGEPDKDERLLLIVDEIDRLLPTGDSPGYKGFATFFGQLRAANQQAKMLDFLVVGVDATVNRVERWRDRDNELYHALREVWLPPMAPNDVEEMIESLGSQMGARYEPEALDLLARSGGGQPFVTRQMCSRAVAARLGRGAITVMPDQAQAAVEEFIFHDPYLREMWRTRLDKTQREMLCQLAQAPESLPRLELLPASQRQEALVALSALEDYTLVRREGNHCAIAWGVLREWIRRVELGLEVQPMYNPYNYQAAVRDDAMFFGREEILKCLVGGLSEPKPLSAAIFGGRRSGKTSLLIKLRRMLDGDARAAGGRCFVPCSLDLQRGRPLKDSDDFFLWVLEELGEVWEKRQGLARGSVVETLQTQYRGEIRRGPVDAFVHAFRSLDTQGARFRLAILIDESENILTAEWGDDLRSHLRYLLSKGPIVEDVGLVMAGSTHMYVKVTERGSPLLNILVRYRLPTLSREATLALARKPNDNRLPGEAAEEVWRQTGGHPCMAQYILHELWNKPACKLEDATAEDVRLVAGTFDARTGHFSAWDKTLGQEGAAVYRFLAEQDGPVTYQVVRQQFSQMTATSLCSVLKALVYHGLIHFLGHGGGQRYEVAGQMYRDWFLSAGKLGETEQPEAPQEPTGRSMVVHGDYVAGDKPTGVDQRGQQVHGPQTNIAGDVDGPVLSGSFAGPVAVGDGEAVDLRGSRGAVYKPGGPVEQQFGSRITIAGDGNVIGDGSRSTVIKQQTAGITVEQFLSLLTELRQALPDAGLDPGVAQAVEADLQVAESQARQPKPSATLIFNRLRSVAELLATADGVLGMMERVRPLAQQALQWAGRLFG